MFASAGNCLNFHVLKRNCLDTVSTYFPKATAEIKTISWCHDNSYIAILQENENPEIVCSKDSSNASFVHTISALPEVTALTFKRNTKRIIALGNKAGEVVFYDTKNRNVFKHLGSLPAKVSCMDFSPTDRELAVTSNKTLVVFNLIDPTMCMEFENPEICSELKYFKKNPNEIAVGCLNGEVLIWDTNEKRITRHYQNHTAIVTGIAFSNTEKFLVTSGRDQKICFIANESGQCIFSKNLHHPITSIDISSDDKYMVAGLEDGSILVYNTTDHLKPLISAKLHPSPVNKISFINGFNLEMMENRNMGGETSSMHLDLTHVQSKPSKSLEEKNCVNIKRLESNSKEPQDATEPLEISEEKVKSHLLKLINNHFSRLEDEIADHCDRFQSLVSSELESLYTYAFRWECFKTGQFEEVIQYLCGVAASNEKKSSSQKSVQENIEQKSCVSRKSEYKNSH